MKPILLAGSLSLVSALTASAEPAYLTSETKSLCSPAESSTQGSMGCHIEVRLDSNGNVFVADRPVAGYGPAEIQSAYSIPTTSEQPTIGIVDYYDDPNAESDLATFRAYFGLAPCTSANGCFKKLNEFGEASPLPPWGGDSTEISLDLDAVSSACPNCKIILLETFDRGPGLYQAQTAAASLGVTVISNSWGGPEYPGEQLIDGIYFDQPGVTIFAAAGDHGYSAGPQYPATSPNVVAVGGTTLVPDTTNARGWSETVWQGTQSGCSGYESQPAWQKPAQTQCATRAINDVSAVADPLTGLAIYDSTSGGWMVVGGTSLATPIVASIFALTGHGDAGPSFAYQNTADFFDVTSGNDGNCSPAIWCAAGPGWDAPTGIGTPNASALAGVPVAAPSPSSSGGGCGLGNVFQAIGQLAVVLPWQVLRRRQKRRAARS